MRHHTTRSSIVGVAALAVLAVPSQATAAPSVVQEKEAPACRGILAGTGTATSDSVAPTVMAGGDEGEWFGLFVNGLSGGVETTFADCAFHDADRDGRFDAHETSFGYKVRFTVDPENGYGIWRQQIAFVGVEQHDQVCSVHSRREQPMAGGKPTSSTSALTCYRVGYYLNGQYYS